MATQVLAAADQAGDQAEPTHHRFVRYHIETETAPDLAGVPSRFLVKVRRSKLAGLLLKEMWHFKLNKKVIASRPCVYGVFGGPVGGFAPRPNMCVGCLRCTTQYPDIVSIHRNPARAAMGDAFFTPGHIDAILMEASTGQVPVKGAGYRGRFGGPGWDGMWTDMSEIVRPTRDGIHGREYISTLVDIGRKPERLHFTSDGRLDGDLPRVTSVPLPILFDVPPPSVLADGSKRGRAYVAGLADAARDADTLLMLPAALANERGLSGRHVVPVVPTSGAWPVEALHVARVVALDGWDEAAHDRLVGEAPQAITLVRIPLGPRTIDRVRAAVAAGAGAVQIIADHHGRGQDDRFIMDWVRDVHMALVEDGDRDAITLIGTGGIIAAEHVPKAIICGLDAVAVDTPPLVAVQANLVGTCRDRGESRFTFPRGLRAPWVRQRQLNMLAAWRDQLLEIMGAMGMREVRRIRGEMGRAMFQRDLEAEAFGGIAGYEA